MNKGFSLLELMVVVTIAGILSAIAVPSYREYKYRANVAEVFIYARTVQKNIEDYYARNGEFPPNNVVATYDRYTPESSNISSIAFYACNESDAHEFSVATTAAATGVLGNEIVFGVHEDDNGLLNWYCRQAGNPVISRSILPASCQAQAYGLTYCTHGGGPTISE